MSRVLPAGSGILACLACAEPGGPVIQPPDAAGAASYLYAWNGSTRGIFASAIEEVVRIPIDLEDIGSLRAFAYDADLSALGLSHGGVALNSPCRPCALLHPDREFALSPSHEWVDDARGMGDFATWLVPDAARCTGCADFEPELLHLEPSDGYIDISTRIAPDAILLLSATGRLSVLSEDFSVRRACVAARGPGLALAGNDVYISVQTSILIYELSFEDAPCKLRATLELPADKPAYQLSASPDGSEVLLGGLDGSVYRIRGTELTLLADDLPSNAPNGGGIAWAAPGRAAIALGGRGVAVYEEGRVHAVALTTGTNAQATSMGMAPEHGYLIGTEDHGVVLMSTDGRMSPIDSGIWPLHRAVEPWRDGYVSLNTFATVRQHVWGLGSCSDGELLEVVTSLNFRAENIFALGEALVVPETTEPGVVALHPRHECSAL